MSVSVERVVKPAVMNRLRLSGGMPHIGTLIGLVCAAIVLFTVTLGPTILGHDPNAIDVLHPLESASGRHWLGTDALGRDFAARLAVGGRASLLIAVGSVALGSVIAIPVGLLAGYAKGWFDIVITRVIDVFLAVPSLLLAIGIVGILGPSQRTTVIALGVAYWPVYARIVRGATVEVLASQYVDLSRAMGAGVVRILWRDVFVALQPVILVQTTAMLGFAVLDEASLGFLGLGVQPPTASWGSILVDARTVILSNPTLSVIAGVPILLTVVAFNLLADTAARRLNVRRSE